MLRDTTFARGLDNAPSRAPELLNGAAPSCGTRHFPLTIAQTPIALDAVAVADSPVANTGDVAHIRGRIDTGLFAAAVRQVVAETQAIRVSLSYLNGALVQEFPDLDDYTLEQQDLSANAQPELAAKTWIEEHFWTPRPWNSFPLFHFALLKISDDHFVLLQKFHHVLADAIGRFQCFQRIACVYDALVQGVEPPLSETLPLMDRLVEEANYLGSNAYETDLAYWTARLEDLPEPLVEIDRGKSERGRSGRPERVCHPISHEDFGHLKEAAAALGSSVPRLALALTYAGISRLYGVNDVVIGTPMHNRSMQAAKRSIDLAMTVMPFRMTFDHDITVAKMLKDIASKQMADRRRSRFPFASLVRSNTQPGAGQAVFDVIFNYIPAMEPISLGGAQVTYSNYSAGFYPPIAIDIRENNDGLGAVLTVTFDQGLIAVDDGIRLARCLQVLLTSSVDLSQQTIGTLPLVNDSERHHLLVELNDNDAFVPPDATLASLCAAQARHTPDAIAVTCGTESITYMQLHAKAEALALHLSAAGVGPEIVVGVALPRSIDLIVTLLAIHKAGGAYLPLDLTLPADRIAYMVRDAQARLIVTASREAEELPQTAADLIYLDDPALSSPPSAAVRLVPASPQNLAYVIYTSGSTGNPKGVAVEHRNAVNLVLHLVTHTAASSLEGVLFSSLLNFDASTDQIFMTLAGGGRLVIVDTLLALPAAPARQQVRILEAAPSVFEALLQVGGYQPGVRLIRFGGEALSRSLVDRILAIDPDVRIENGYGPTETTVYATIAQLGANDRREPTIGKGLRNVKLYVLDRHMQLLPKGARGELYIGGAGVSRGYLNRPELTAERFVENPFGEGRLYRTGDIVRWREDGELDYFNRTDEQVKINGLRIELGEIERQLESMPEIAGAAVLVQADDNGVKRIFAFAIARNANSRPDMPAVNRHLQKTLPKYMLPAAVTWLDSFPLTSSGKLDRNALPLPTRCDPQRSYRAPSSRDEALLVRTWSDVLQIQRIGVDDDFFDLGGTSLQAVMIFARIAKSHGLDLPAATMMRAPTIARLVALLKEAAHAEGKAKLVAFREKGDGPPLFFVHGGGGGVMHVRDIMQDLRSRNPLYGLRPPPLDGTERLPGSIEKFAAAYIEEMHKIQSTGPYHIFGYSAGGTISYEIARQLTEAGETVGLAGIIETNPMRYNGAIQPKPKPKPVSANRAHKPFGAARRIARRTADRFAVMRETIGAMSNRLRHSLGIPIPHDQRIDFYSRWFKQAEIAYAPKHYPGTITLFTRKKTAHRYRALWSDLADTVSARELPVDNHLEIVLLPNSRFLAMQIDASLDELAAAKRR